MNSSISYTGKSSYKYVERLLRESRELLIVSPFIDAYYAKMLRSCGSRKRIRIISSSIDAMARKLLETGRPIGPFLSLLFLIAAFDYLAYLLSFLLVYILPASAIIVLIAFAAMLNNDNHIELKVPKEFVHAKMYISDRECILGSANLTYRGMHLNTEHIEVKKDAVEVDRLRSEFWKIWRSAE